MRTKIIFSDLDGTLLHPRTYSFAKAREALDRVQELGVPLVLVSSKTRAELEVWRERLANEHPFIVENGGGIFIPEGYFSFPVGGVHREGYRVVPLGMPYASVRQRFLDLRAETGAAVRGFGDMTLPEVMDLTGLTREDAQLAVQRDFDEPFIFSEKKDERFLQAIEGAGLRWTRGRLYHIMGDHHKGRAVAMLCELYKQMYGALETVGIGDSLNDIPFLLVVDRPVLVRRLPGGQEKQMRIPALVRTAADGPAGWNEAVLTILGAGSTQPPD